MKTLSQTPQTRFQSNENLLKVMMQYLSPKDIASLSQVNKFFNKTTKHFDFQFKEVSHEFFCSQYENYSLENQLNESIILSSSNSDMVKGTNDQEEIMISIQSSSPSLFTWKQLLNIGMKIKQSWLSNPHQTEFIDDLTLVSQYIYSNLKECEILPRLRKQNHIIESDFNSSLQTYLFDFIYEQQDLYEEYNPKMADLLSNNKPIQCRKQDIPFCDFINRFGKLKESISDTPDKIDVLHQLRWYMCFNIEDNSSICKKDNSLRQKIVIDWQMQMNSDNNSFYNNNSSCGDNVEEDSDSIFDSIVVEKEQETNNNNHNTSNGNIHNISNSITTTTTTTNTITTSTMTTTKDKDDTILNNDIIAKLLQQESNPLFFVIRCIMFTLTFYCQYSMNYINSTFTKDTDILSEYIKIYKNYIDTAIGMNDYCENINVAMNYCYESICKDSPSLPKFSIFRLFVIIWNKEVSKQLNNNQSMLNKVKQSIINLYFNSIHDLTDLLKTKSKGECNSNSNNAKFKSNYDDISIGESFSTKYSFNINESFNPLFTMSSNDDASESCLKIEDSLESNLIEQGLGMISDTFCDEFNVFSLNSSEMQVNKQFNQIEEQMIDIVDNMINNVYEHNTITTNSKLQEDISGSSNIEGSNNNSNGNGAWIKTLVDDLIKFFTSTFYSSRLLTQFKLRLYEHIHSSLRMKIIPDLVIDFKSYILNKKLTITKEFKAKTYFELHPNTLKCDSVYQTLFNSMSMQQNSQDVVKEYCVVRYIIETGKSQGSLLSGLKQLDDWISDERDKGLYKNKQIEKELKRKNIQCKFTPYEKEMLSMSWMPNLDVVGKAKEMIVLKKAQSCLNDKSLNAITSTSYVNGLDRDNLALALKLV